LPRKSAAADVFHGRYTVIGVNQLLTKLKRHGQRPHHGVLLKSRPVAREAIACRAFAAACRCFTALAVAKEDLNPNFIRCQQESTSLFLGAQVIDSEELPARIPAYGLT
jgi:hypothetical protein